MGISRPGHCYKLNWDIQADPLSSGKIVECLTEFNPLHRNLYMVYRENNSTQLNTSISLILLKINF